MKKFNITSAIKRPKKIYYVSGCNITYSFRTLTNLLAQLGGEDGDIIIIDNLKQDKRKAFQKVKNGWIIIYCALDKRLLFSELETDDNSEYKERRNILDLFKV